MPQPNENKSSNDAPSSRRRFLRQAARGVTGAAVGGGAAAAYGAQRPDVAPKTRRSVQSAGPVASVREFGAVGDGETDDTEAVRRAVAAAPGGIFFPKGRYRLTETVTIELSRVGPLSLLGDGTATVVMNGSGPAFHLVGTHEGTANPATVTDQVWNQERAPLIDGFEIVGDHEEAVGLRLERTMQPVISRLAVRQALHGIHLVQRNRNVIISECQVYENSGIGIYLDAVNLHQINISNSHVSYNRAGGIVVRASEVRNLHIGVCDIEGNMSEEGPPTANVLIDAREGTVREGTITGCTIQHSSGAPDSANVRLVGRQPPIKAGRFSIADNDISDTALNIHIQDSRGITITGNNFWIGSDYHVLVEGSSHVVLSANLFERNPDYGSSDNSRNGIEFFESEYCTISDLHLQQTTNTEASLILRNCQWVNVSNSFIIDFDETGVLLEEVAYVRIANCTIRASDAADGDRVAIAADGGRGNMIVNNFLGGTLDVPSENGVVTGNQRV